MKLINADYLTGRIFTEASLKNAHTCYESIMAIIESMESEDVLNKIRAEIENDWQLKKYPSSPFSCGLRRAIEIIDKYKEGEQNEK